MRKITAKNFKETVALEPAWASKLTVPVEITGYCDISRSKITHLSPLLHFTGRDERGECASFANCKDLEVATGTFHGGVNFSQSGVKRIEKLNVLYSNKQRDAVAFYQCKKLRIATGTYPGWTCFTESGIRKIQDLVVTQPDKSGTAAEFWKCSQLRVATGTFHGFVNFAFSGIECIKNLTITKPDNDGNAADFSRCFNLKVATGTYPGYVSFEESGIERIEDLTINKPNKVGKTLGVIDCPKVTSIPNTFHPKEVTADPNLLRKLIRAHTKAALAKAATNFPIPEI